MWQHAYTSAAAWCFQSAGDHSKSLGDSWRCWFPVTGEDTDGMQRCPCGKSVAALPLESETFSFVVLFLIRTGELLASQLIPRVFKVGLCCESGGGRSATCAGAGSCGPWGFAAHWLGLRNSFHIWRCCSISFQHSYFACGSKLLFPPCPRN